MGTRYTAQSTKHLEPGKGHKAESAVVLEIDGLTNECPLYPGLPYYFGWYDNIFWANITGDSTYKGGQDARGASETVICTVGVLGRSQEVETSLTSVSWDEGSKICLWSKPSSSMLRQSPTCITCSRTEIC